MPNKELEAFLDEKVTSVKNRVYEATGVKIDPIYYSAGYKEEGVEQTKPYNLSKLLYYIVKSTPEKKRVIIADNINEAPDLWKGNDRRENYGRQTVETLQTSIADTVFGGTGLLDIGKKVVKGVFSVGKAIVGGISRIFRGLFG
jgi:predicted GTPase